MTVLDDRPAAGTAVTGRWAGVVGLGGGRGDIHQVGQAAAKRVVGDLVGGGRQDGASLVERGGGLLDAHVQ